MNLTGIRFTHRGRSLSLCAVLALFLMIPALSAGKEKGGGGGGGSHASAPHPSGGGGAHPSGGGMGGSHGPSTSGGGAHGPTTSGGGSHGPTTSGGGAGHTTTTTGGGRTTTSTTGGGSHGGTTTGGGHTTTSTTGGGGTHGGNNAGGGGTHGGNNAGGGRVANGQHVSQTRNGGSVTRRADGRVASVHDSKRGMDVHRGMNGNRRAVSERGDHSRVVAYRGGRGYVQRPFSYRGHEFARRSFYGHGRYYHGYYGRYYYHGAYINPYYPAAYWGPAYYGWVYNPWAAPIAYAGWGWAGNPWYGYYGGFFTPFPTYAAPAFWLTDYLIANSLQEAYDAQVAAQQTAALNGAAPMTPDVKQAIADEVRRQVALENSESQGGGQSAPDDASSSIQRVLSDGQTHVFVAGSDLDVMDGGGNECALSEGDAIQLSPGQNDPNSTAVNVAVLASKGGGECPKGATVSVAVDELQEMQNHMRMTIDQGMQELQKKQGSGGLPAAPASAKAPPTPSAMAAAAPPPPPQQEVQGELTQENQQADAAEQDAAADTGGAPAGGAAAAPAGPPPTVSLGQSPDQVTAAMGKPKSVMNLGPKQIYVYQDMKVTFKNGKVSDVQ